jgi:hypothetical protein
VARAIPDVLRDDSRCGRVEMRDGLSASQQALDNRLNLAGQSQAEQLARLLSAAIESRTALEASLKRNSGAFSETQTQRLGETNSP